VAKSLASRQTAVAYTKDGKYLLAVDQRQNRTDTIADEDKLRVLDAATLETVRKLPISGGDAVTVSPDGRYAASPPTSARTTSPSSRCRTRTRSRSSISPPRRSSMPGYGTTNPVSLTYDDLGDGDADTGRVIFNTLQGALSVDPDKPLGPNAARLYDNSHDVLPDGAGGHWIRFSDQRVQHRDRNGTVLAERPNTGWEFGGERIGGRTFNAFFGAVSVYDLAAGTPLGLFEVKLPGRNGFFEDAAVTPGGDLLVAETDPQTFAVELYLVRDPETIR
jgi:hypothetical protein